MRAKLTLKKSVLKGVLVVALLAFLWISWGSPYPVIWCAIGLAIGYAIGGR